MIRDQCHAFCQCSYCAQQPQEKSTNAGASMRATMEALDRPGMSKDELYMKSLQQSLQAKAFLDSSKNSGKFIPDEQLLSSVKRREAKELAKAADLVPVRRRDRLQELVLLEHKNRLREEAALRAERRALGLPDEEEEALSEPKPETPASARPSSEASSQQHRLSSGSATPASRCSAEHELNEMLKGIKGIVDENPSATKDPLSRNEVYRLRQLLHNQKKKAREMVESCEQQPHVCGHCLDMNVQARHVCPPPQCSVAFGEIGKVINPEEGIQYGADTKRGFDGTYNSAVFEAAAASSKKGRLSNYSNHPYGSGMVFLPVSSVNGGSRTSAGDQSTRFRASFNNNISRTEPVEAELQFPGSTYNVYDAPRERVATPQAAKMDNVDRTATIESVSSNTSQNGPNAQSGKATAADGSTAAAPTYNSSAAMWRTTNQDRALDVERYMEFQRQIKANSKRVYAGGNNQSTKAASA